MANTNLLLYPANATSFVGSTTYLSSATSCTVTEERNGKYILEMDYPVNGINYNLIELRKIITAIPNTSALSPEPFRIVSISRSGDETIQVTANHLSYDLSNYNVRPFSTSTRGVQEALEYLSSRVVPNVESFRRFRFDTDKTDHVLNFYVEEPRTIRSALMDDNDSILATYKGDLSFRTYLVYLHKSRGSDKSVPGPDQVVIRHGKNLSDYDQEEDASDVFTGIYPYITLNVEQEKVERPSDGVIAVRENSISETIIADLIELDSSKTSRTVFVKNDQGQRKYDYDRVSAIDMTDYFDEDFIRVLQNKWYAKDASEYKKQAASLLAEYADKYIKDNQIDVPNVTIEVEYVPDTDPEYENINVVQLCDRVKIIFSKTLQEATAKCILTKYNVLEGRYDSIELGDTRSTLAKTMASKWSR